MSVVVDVDNNGMVVDAIQDISKITTIPVRTLDKLVSKIDWCICDAIEESRMVGEDLTRVDIGVGVLCIYVKDNEIEYKFLPAPKLEKYVIDTVVNKKNPMVVNLEQTFVNRITKTYKDMF